MTYSPWRMGTGLWEGTEWTSIPGTYSLLTFFLVKTAGGDEQCSNFNLHGSGKIF